MVTFVWIPQVATLPIIRHDMNMTIDCLSTNLSITIAIVKLFVLQYQRSVVGTVVNSMAKDWQNIQTKDEWEAMMVTGRISSLNSKISFCVTTLSFSGVVVIQLFVILGSGEDPDRDPRLAYGFVMESYFPFNTSSPLIFVPLWLTQTFSTGLSAATYAAPDCFVSTLGLHLCGQLNIVRYLLRNLANDTTTQQPVEYWKRLCVIVRRHEHLNQRTYVMDKLFSTLLLAQMLICSVTFCCQGYAMFRRTVDLNGEALPIPVLVFRIFYAACTIEHLFVCCYVGERLSAESTSISDAFYETPWYDLAPKEARAFLLVCQRSNRPLELRAGKFCTFNLQLFNTIMKNSMGYISMLMAMKDRLID
nr:olfactory receptor 69 [Gregopimpla kuwanae]